MGGVDPTLTTWVVNLVLAGVVSLVGFFARNAFGRVEETLGALVKKLDEVGVKLATMDGDRRVLEQRVSALEHEVRELRESMSEGVRR